MNKYDDDDEILLYKSRCSEKKQKEAARRVYLLTYVTLINIRATTTEATATANSSNFLHQI